MTWHKNYGSFSAVMDENARLFLRTNGFFVGLHVSCHFKNLSPVVCLKWIRVSKCTAFQDLNEDNPDRWLNLCENFFVLLQGFRLTDKMNCSYESNFLDQFIIGLLIWLKVYQFSHEIYGLLECHCLVRCFDAGK